jgi:hypothetical protein
MSMDAFRDFVQHEVRLAGAPNPEGLVKDA